MRRRAVLKYSLRGMCPQKGIDRILLELGITPEKIEVVQNRPGSSLKYIFVTTSQDHIEVMRRKLVRFPAVSLIEEKILAPISSKEGEVAEAIS